MQNETPKNKAQNSRPFAPKGHADKIDALIGERIRNRRGRLGLSQAKLGQAVGLTFQQIQKYERGINRVSASTLLDIADALTVDVGYFYESLLDAAPMLADGAQKKYGPAQIGKKPEKSFVRPDPQTEDLVAIFQDILNPKHKRQLLELARTFAESPRPGKTSSER